MEAVGEPGRLLELVKLHRPDAVVIDGSGSLSAAAQTVAAIEAFDARVRVVVVAEDAETDSGQELFTLPKWRSLEVLAEEVGGASSQGG